MSNLKGIIKKQWKKFLMLFLVLGVVGVVVFRMDNAKQIEFIEFNEMLFNKDVVEVFIDLSEPEFKFKDNNGVMYVTENPKSENFKKDVLMHNVKITELPSIPFLSIISVAISLGLLLTLLKQMNVTGKKNNKKVLKPKEDFSSVAGLTPVKKDLEFLVDFMKNATKYADSGAELPKGVIFYGQPGTGKTLLARAIAGEANVPFYSTSGSEFIEMFVGRGAKRVRDLFETAKKNAPCIIFIDEIDAIGKVRGVGASTNEHEQTLNQLLSEMDGFNSSNGILVIGATNRLEVLDNALLRPGRFDNHICVPLPSTPNERLEIINLYSKNKNFIEGFDFKELSKQLTGFSPSDIKSLLNESAIVSIQMNKEFIDKECVDKALFKKLLKGHEKHDKDRNKKDLEIVAWHEAGHALMAEKFGVEVPKVTIIQSTSGAGGVTFINPKSNELLSKKDLKEQILINYGGRCAEEILLKDKDLITVGASQDMKTSTSLIKQMIKNYGMSNKYGLLNLNELDISSDEILAESLAISEELYKDTLATLIENKETLKLIAESLIENETISGEDLANLIK